MKQRLLTLHLLLLVAVGMLAKDFTTSYYTSANGKKGEALKTALYNIIKSPSVTSYDGLYEGYKKTDNRVINDTTYVRDWYSTTTRYTHVTDKAGSYSKEGDCYNREHSVPQSWFGSGDIKSDIVHVLPTDGYVNNRRGNYPFGEVGSATYTSNGGYCKLGSAKSGLGYSGTVFEPNDEIKGDIARIYFYMCTCYQDKCTSWGHDVFTGTTYSPLSSWALAMFMEWSENDPVDDVEIARNNAVQDVQGNRNPFVDFPGLEQYVWGTLTSTAININSYSSPYETSNLTTPTFTFNETAVTKILGDAAFQYQATTNSDGTLSYTSSNTNVATVSSDGTVTIGSVAGTTTITASVPATNTYKAASGSYVLTVKASASDPDTPTGDYVKVTSANDLTDGQYLIVYEDGKLAYDGGSTTLNTSGATISVTISDATIASTETTDAAAFTIDFTAGTIKSASGYYIGNTASGSNQTLFSTETAYTNTITYNSNSSCVDIVASCGNYLRYNTSGYFRYYKVASYANQKAIQLYKKQAGSSTGGDTGDDTPADPVAPTVSFTTSSVTLTVGDEAGNEADTNSDGVLTYTSSNTQVATVDEESGMVTAIAEGTATITATVAATDNYTEGTASYTLTVTAPAQITLTGSGTADDPYIVADVNLLFDNSQVPTSSVYVKGIISKINEVSTNYGNATYFISDYGSTDDGSTTDHLEIYRGKSLDNASFTSTDEIQVGDTVVVYGTLTLYNTTREFTTGSYIVSLARPESTTPDDPTPAVDSDCYVKVTSAPNDWSGKYLIVYEGGNVAMNGGLTDKLDAVSNTIGVTIDNNTIASSAETDAAAFTITRDNSNNSVVYLIQGAGGLYMGQTTNANGLASSATEAYTNTISLDGSDVNIIGSGGAYLRYNASDNQTRFRYYKSSSYTNQKAIQLYKFVAASQPETVTGDVDGNKELDQTDLQTLVGIVVGNLVQGNYHADVDGDGSVSLKDITALVNLLVQQQQQQSGE